ncbi:MAG: polyprenyl diphosphate synthase [Candidatus Micrarchaeaceae archaeon]
MNEKNKRGIVPYHIAIIPDGNRRWAKSNQLILPRSYSIGIKKFIDVSLWAKELGVKVITVWALSLDNIKMRSKIELKMLYNLYEKTARSSKIIKILKDNKAKVKVIGHLELLPSSLKAALLNLEKATVKYNSLKINLLIGYGGKDDFLYAFKNLLKLKSEKIYYKDIENNLLSSEVPDIDLIIRTSGELRLSGFLPWQSEYSELYFSNKYWPEFDRQELIAAIDSFSKRERRFGK